MSTSNYSVVLVLDPGTGWHSVLVPAMPGCVTQGRTRDDALANAREAMALWVEAEAELGRGPLPQTPSLVLAGVAEALQIIDDMRAAGEWPRDGGYGLEVAQVAVTGLPVAA
jgi:antitoxin HicB